VPVFAGEASYTNRRLLHIPAAPQAAAKGAHAAKPRVEFPSRGRRDGRTHTHMAESRRASTIIGRSWRGCGLGSKRPCHRSNPTRAGAPRCQEWTPGWCKAPNVTSTTRVRQPGAPTGPQHRAKRLSARVSRSYDSPGGRRTRPHMLGHPPKTLSHPRTRSGRQEVVPPATPRIQGRGRNRDLAGRATHDGGMRRGGCYLRASPSGHGGLRCVLTHSCRPLRVGGRSF
jgi:hypothetical protein